VKLKKHFANGANVFSFSHYDKILQTMQWLVFGFLILYFGRDIFIPLCFAALISFVLYPICLWMEQHSVNRMLAIIISVIALMILLFAVVALLAKQFVDFFQEWGLLQQKISHSLDLLSQYAIDSLGISREQQTHWVSQAMDQSVKSILTFLQNTISFSAISAVMLILVPVYAVMILYYRHKWVDILYRIFPGERKRNIRHILHLTIKAYYNFIKGMGLVYLIVGVLNSIGLLVLGVPHAILFGFIASVLTFIPYIGIIIGSLLPITMAWLTYDSIWYPIGIIGVFTFVQYIEANLIFPFAVSNRLKVNTLVVLVSIFIGSLVWGVAGMILFVPFVGILKLIADNNPKLKTLSMALGENENED
jgi:predicted PurR-regulated permease PerM